MPPVMHLVCQTTEGPLSLSRYLSPCLQFDLVPLFSASSHPTVFVRLKMSHICFHLFISFALSTSSAEYKQITKTSLGRSCPRKRGGGLRAGAEERNKRKEGLKEEAKEGELLHDLSVSTSTLSNYLFLSFSFLDDRVDETKKTITKIKD